MSIPVLPKQLIDSLKSLPGFDENEFINAHDSDNKITSIRLNLFKKVQLDFDVNEPVRWCDNAYYLNERPSFTLDPLFHAGCYYVQEAGSMFLEFALKSVLDTKNDLKILDLCAAPGGKSTLINSLLSENSLLIANEVTRARADILTQNLSKWGTCNSIVTNSDPQKFSALPEYFDAIVVDAPCSGSGLFRKQPEAINEWSLENVNTCSARQKRILADIIPSLKENGHLIYSTCSYSFEEDEAIVEWLIKDFGMEYLPLKIDKNWGITETSAGYRFYPHLTKSEGFFCAVLKKVTSENISVKNNKKTSFTLNKSEIEAVRPYFNPESRRFFKNGNQIHLLNEPANHFIHQFGKSFYFKKAGIAIGEIKGKDLVPNQELAWFKDLKCSNQLDLNKDEALAYLRKQAFSANIKQAGFTIISYKDKGLGWAKILPNRINNYLPNELRIIN